jgi:hypothetical protein
MNNSVANLCVKLPSKDSVRGAQFVDLALKLGMAATTPTGELLVNGRTVLKRPVSNGTKHTIPIAESGNLIKFDGKIWTFCFAGEVVQDIDRLGWRYTGQLVENAYREQHVTKLVTGFYGEPDEIMKVSELAEDDVAREEFVDDDGNESSYVITAEFKDEILPDENRDFVHKLLEEQYELLAVLKSKGKPYDALVQKQKVKKLRLDIKKVERYLDKYRFFGRNKCVATRAECDRKSVMKAIRSAIGKIAGKHPALAEHFTESIITGEYCEYRPACATSWRVAICPKS